MANPTNAVSGPEGSPLVEFVIAFDDWRLNSGDGPPKASGVRWQRLCAARARLEKPRAMMSLLQALGMLGVLVIAIAGVVSLIALALRSLL